MELARLDKKHMSMLSSSIPPYLLCAGETLFSLTLLPSSFAVFSLMLSSFSAYNKKKRKNVHLMLLNS